MGILQLLANLTRVKFSETAVSHGLLATPLSQCPIVQLTNQKPEQFKDLTTCLENMEPQDFSEISE